MSPTKTALYLRQSFDRHGDMLAVDRQRDGCRALCAQRGWTDMVEYTDNDISATNGKPRPAYNRLLADIRAGKITALVVWDLDRLYRQPRELEDLIDLADAKRLALATVTGDVDLASDNGRLYARIKGAVAKAEVERKSTRQKAAAEQRAKHGRAWWPTRPFGFQMPPGKAARAAGADATVELHPDEAALIRKAYTDVLGGASLHGIAQDWNRRGVTTPKGNRWRGAQVRQLLLNPRNAGLRSYRGELVGDAAWPAIVPRDVFDGVAAILADPTRRAGKTRARKHLLTGIARCGKCGGPVGSAMARARPVYTCKACFGVVRDAASVDMRVVGAVVERLSRDAADLLVAVDPDVADELRDRAKALQAKIDAAHPLWKRGIITDAELADTRADLGAQLAAIKAQLNDTHRAEIFDGVIGADHVGEAFDNLSLDRQRAIVAALWPKDRPIVIKPTGRGQKFDPESVDTPFG